MVELGCRGAVVLSTCNRTEVYLSLDEGQDLDPRALLCQAAGISSGTFGHAFITRWGVDCARHLMEVACGLRSQILGEDQILTQVKAAVALAREAGSADGVLETLFRTAAACGNSAKAGGRLSGVPTSAAHRAVEVLRERWEHWREGPPWSSATGRWAVWLRHCCGRRAAGYASPCGLTATGRRWCLPDAL